MSESMRKSDLPFVRVMQSYQHDESATPNRSIRDGMVYKNIRRRFENNYVFYANKLEDEILPFSTILQQVREIKPVRDNQNNVAIVVDVQFQGSSKLKTAIGVLRNGKPGEPIIAHIPGFGSPANTILPLMTGIAEVDGCTIVGIETFHDRSEVDRVKVASRFENLQKAFASSTVALEETMRIAQIAGSPLYVIGGSFGAKAINIALNNPVSGELLAARYMAIEGGRLDETFIGHDSYYARHIPPDAQVFLQHPMLLNGSAFPYQSEPMPKVGAQRTTAVVNLNDPIAQGQGSVGVHGRIEGIWAGADRIIRIGEHSRLTSGHVIAPLRDGLRIRRAIANDLRALKA